MDLHYPQWINSLKDRLHAFNANHNGLEFRHIKF